MLKKANNTEIISLLNLLIKIAKEDEKISGHFTVLLEFLMNKYKASVYDR